MRLSVFPQVRNKFAVRKRIERTFEEYTIAGAFKSEAERLNIGRPVDTREVVAENGVERRQSLRLIGVESRAHMDDIDSLRMANRQQRGNIVREIRVLGGQGLVPKPALHIDQYQYGIRPFSPLTGGGCARDSCAAACRPVD